MFLQYFIERYNDYRKNSRKYNDFLKRPCFYMICWCLLVISMLYFIGSLVYVVFRTESLTNISIYNLLVSSVLFIILLVIMSIIDHNWAYDVCFSKIKSYIDYCIDLHEHFRNLVKNPEQYEEIIKKAKETRLELEKRITHPVKIAIAIFSSVILALDIASIQSILDAMLGSECNEINLESTIKILGIINFWGIVLLISSFVYKMIQKKRIILFNEFERDFHTIIEIYNGDFDKIFDEKISIKIIFED